LKFYFEKSESLKVFYIVHGAVQGVGYRWFVKRMARRNGVDGIVRNAANGSVEILADADEQRVLQFEKDINVSVGGGPQVFNIERYPEHERGFRELGSYKGFVISKD